MYVNAVAASRAVSKLSIAVLLLTLTLTLGSRSAWADSAGKERVTALLNQSLAAFAERKWPESRKSAEEAEAATALGGFTDAEKRSVLARIRVVLGAIQVEGFHNPGEGVSLFRRALKEDASAKLTKTLATADVKNAFKTALIMVRSEAGADVVTEAPPPSAAAPEQKPADNEATAAAAKEKAAKDKAAAEKAAQEKAAQEKVAQEKAAQEKAAQEKAAQEKAAQEKAAKAKSATAAKAAPVQEEAEKEEEEELSLEELRRRAREKKFAQSDSGSTKDSKPTASEAKPASEPTETAAKPETKPEAKPEAKPAESTSTPKPVVVAKPPEEKKPEEPDLPADIPEPLYCPNALEAPPRRTGVLRCVLQPEIQAAKVVFFYRISGKEEFETQDATRTPGGWLIAAAPAAAFVGKSLHYYFEAKDANGEVVAVNGSFMSPNMMLVREGSPPLGLDAFAGMRVGGVEISEKDENPLADRIFGIPGEPPPEQRYWVSFGLGTGYGFHGAQQLEWYEYENAPGSVSIPGGGRSAGQILIAPEAGYRFTHRLSVALAVRGQIILHEGSESVMAGAPAPAAFSVMAKGIYTYPIGERITLHGWFGLGGGEGVRLVIPADPENVDRNRDSSDTVAVGPILTGIGIAADYHLFDAWSVRVNFPQMLIALPTFGTVFDATAGAVYAF